MKMDDIDAGPRAEGAATLIADLVRGIPELFRKEMALLRSELGDKVDQAVAAAGMIVAGLVFALVALDVLAAALVVAVTAAGLAPGWSALLVGGLIAVAAFALVKKGANDLKASRLAPRRTAENLAQDARVMKEAL